jgi:hypothetical protein
MPTAALASQRAGAATRRTRAHAVAQLLSIVPFGILLAVTIDPQARRLAPLESTPSLLGLPADVALGAVVLVWMLIGTLIIRFARSPLTEALALLIFTIPATIGAVLAPAVVLLLASHA